MKFHSIYLWQNKADEYQQVVSWCSRDQYGRIATDSFFAENQLATHISINLRDKKSSLSLNDLLGDTIFTTFSTWLQALDQDEYLRLHLLNTLPYAWQQLPLEWAQWQGRPLHQKVQIVRYAALPKSTLPIRNEEQALIINLWPQATNQRQFFENMIVDASFQVVQGRFKSTLYIKNNDVSHLSLLCVIGHGNEAESEAPLLCEQNKAWALPHRQLPPLVLLAACGGEQGNLLDYAQKLLKQGARTVLAARGKLDASQMTDFLGAFFQLWKKGMNPESILFQLQAQTQSEHAARRIHVIGQSGLCHYNNENHQDISEWNLLTKVALDDNDALLILLDQLTLHNLVSYSSLESSVNDLYEALGFNYNDPHEKRSLLYDRLEQLYPKCQPITQKWLSYFLMYLSTLHQHDAIDKYQREVNALQKIKTLGLESFFFYIASANYRSRQHEQAMNVLMDGLNMPLSVRYLDTRGETNYKLTELALNISIVMGLPELGLFFHEQANATLSLLNLDEEQRALETFTQLDRGARLYVRTGDPDNELEGDAGLIRGLYELQQKRTIAIKVREETGERELCLLLFFSAWLKHQIPNPVYVQQALSLLEPVEEVCAELTSATGNLTKLYLLRALSAWAWRQNDSNAIALLEQYLPTIITLCNQTQRNNAAPLGFIIAQMALLGNPEAKQQWFFIANKMLSDQCYFELAIFHRLLGEDRKAIHAYKHHRQQQHRVFGNMKALQHSKHLEEYKTLIQQTETRLAREDVMDIMTFDLDDIQQLGFMPF